MLKRQTDIWAARHGEVLRESHVRLVKLKAFGFLCCLHLLATTPPSSLDLFINTLNIH